MELEKLLRETDKCECYTLTEILPEGTIPANLPDHICYHTMKASCRNWLEDSYLLIPEATQFPIRFPVGNGLIAQCNSEDDWPLKAVPLPKFTPIYAAFLVIRQWVEEPVGGQLVKAFNSTHWRTEWNSAVIQISMRYDIVKMGFETGLLTPEYLPIMRQSKSNIECVMTVMAQELLSSLGLPATPGTTKYLLSQIKGQPFDPAPSGPTIGALLTTIGIGEYVDFGESFGDMAEMCALRGDMAFQIAGSSRWTSDELKKRASKLVKAHTDKWKQWQNLRVPNPNLGQFRSSKFDDEEAEII